MFHSLHKVARNQQLVYLKKHTASESTAIADPDTFPISNLSDRLVEERVSIWEERKQLKLRAGHLGSGFVLEEAPSTINHHQSGNGVFIRCAPESPQVLPPGTLLGFFPGLINRRDQQPPDTPQHSMDTYLKRYDGFWIDPDGLIVYPYRGVISKFLLHLGKLDYISEYQEWKAAFGKDKTDIFMIQGKDINPYALGHIINHPPPGHPANCIFIDLDLPFTFFTAEYSRYLPFMYESFPMTKYQDSSFHHGVFRGIGILSKYSIASGQELFVDYLQELDKIREDERVPYYTQPDWLIAPPPDSKYLTKEHYFHEFGKFEKYLDKKEQEQKGDLGVEFLERTKRLDSEEAKPMIESKKKFERLIEERQRLESE